MTAADRAVKVDQRITKHFLFIVGLPVSQCCYNRYTDIDKLYFEQITS